MLLFHRRNLVVVLIVAMVVTCLSTGVHPGIAKGATGKKVLILAPHEDDEALMAAGIIEQTLADGDSVKVVVATNGDYNATDKSIGKKRIGESVAAMSYLGLESSDLIFMGYGDTGSDYSISFLNKLYNAETDTTIVPSSFTSQTYGTLNHPDYHYQKFGSHGAYNRATFRQDLESIIDTYQPTDIFVPGIYDQHGDHMGLYLFTVETIVKIKKLNPGYSPMVYEMSVHTSDTDAGWPLRDDDAAPMTAFTKPTTLDWSTLYDWDSRIIFPVPADMLGVPRSTNNRKHIAISKYESQIWDHLYSFVKEDEVFFASDYSNIALLANVTVSSETTSTEQTGTKVNDGFKEGYPRFPKFEWATDGQTTKAWVQLNWTQTYTINKIKLYDRPNTTDNIANATLTFSDGTSISVGSLPSDGKAKEITFTPKNVSWVKLTINGTGENIGLSEFEVYPSL